MNLKQPGNTGSQTKGGECNYECVEEQRISPSTAMDKTVILDAHSLKTVRCHGLLHYRSRTADPGCLAHGEVTARISLTFVYRMLSVFHLVSEKSFMMFLYQKVYNNDGLPDLIVTNLSPMGRRMFVAQLGEVSTSFFLDFV